MKKLRKIINLRVKKSLNSYEANNYVLHDDGDLKDVFEFASLNHYHYCSSYEEVLQKSMIGSGTAGTGCVGFGLSKIEGEDKRLALQLYLAEKPDDFYSESHMKSTGIVSFMYFQFATQQARIIIDDPYGLAKELANSKSAWGSIFDVIIEMKPKLDYFDNRSSNRTQMVV